MRIIIVLFLSIWSLNLVNGQDIVLPDVAKYKGWSPLDANLDTIENFSDFERLYAKLRKAKNKVSKLKVLNLIAETHNNGQTVNTDSVRFYCKKVFAEISNSEREQSKEINRQYLLALQTKALAYSRLANPKPDSMFQQLTEIKKMAQEQGDLFNLADCYNNLGNYYAMLGNLDSARQNYLMAIKLGEKIGFYKVLSFSYGNIAYHLSQNTDLQKECFLRAFYNGLKNHDLSLAIDNLTRLAFAENDKDIASTYMLKLDAFLQANSDSDLKATSYLQMGHFFRNETFKAYNYFSLAANNAKESGNDRLLGRIYHGIADMYLDVNEVRLSEKYHKMALGIFEQLNDDLGKGQIMNHMAKEYMATKKYREASVVINKLLVSLNRSDILRIFYFDSWLVIAYSNLQEFNKAEVLLDTLNSILLKTNFNSNPGLFNLFQLANFEYYYNMTQFDKAKIPMNFLLSKDANNIDFLTKAYEVAKEQGDITKALECLELLVDLLADQNAKEDVKGIAKLEFREQMKIDSVASAEKAYQTELKYELKLSNDKRTKSVLLSSAVILLLLSGGFFLRWKTTKKAKVIIEHEKHIAEHERARSDELLLNILPAEVAEELKNTGTSEAKHFDEVSILFTDFKGFTQASEKLSPKDLVNEINTCFKAFDNICDKYGIEKIKTIGDSYMAASGLGHGSKDKVQSLKDASNMVSAALEMQHFMTTLNSRPDQFGVKPETRVPSNSGLNFQMRCGIHTGPVVAGIVGVKKFQYDIWGDTVNTASRMESHGEVGKVNISEETYQILRHPGLPVPMHSGEPESVEFTFEAREMVNVKGKGDLAMFFVKLKEGPDDQTKV